MSLFANIGGKPLPEYMLSNLPPQEELLERVRLAFCFFIYFLLVGGLLPCLYLL